MNRYVAFLRAVNVGGRSKLPMTDLRELLASMDYRNVRTYIQSGNIIFEAPALDEAEAAGEIQAAIEERFGVASPVVLRDRDEFEALAGYNPFDVDSIEPVNLHVMLLDKVPAPEDVERLDPDRSPGDSYVVHGREIYLHFPNGAGRSKLSVDYFDRNLGVVATARNWNTIQKLRVMLADD